jgi:hypothetical protein
MNAEIDEWIEDFDEYARPFYRGGENWDAVRYMECLPDWNMIPTDNFSPDLIDDPSNCIPPQVELW